jgi:hypothetical protein
MKSPSLAVVKNFCNDQLYTIPVDGHRSYAPGENALAASYTGTPGELLIAGATADRRGASEFAINASIRSADFQVTPPVETIPAATRNTYLGIFAEEHPTTSGAWRLRAWLYADGAFLSELRVSDYLYGPVLTQASAWQRVHARGDFLLFGAIFSAYPVSSILWWDIGTGAAGGSGPTVGDFLYYFFHAGPVWPGAGEFVYVCASLGSPNWHLLALPVDQNDGFNPVDFWVNNPEQLTVADLDVAGVLCGTGLDWQLPALDTTANTSACPYVASTVSGVWQEGRGRVLVDPATAAAVSCGWPVSGNRSARLARLASGNLTVGLLGAGPASPELALIPDTWGLDDCRGISVAPSGGQFAVYPATFPGDTGPTDKLLRLAVQGSAYPADAVPERITVQPGPNGELPHVMLCRD